MTRTIVFDFDGTLAIGHGPVLAFADCVAPLAGKDYLARVKTALDEYDAGRGNHRDGYHVVGALAAEDGVAAEALSDAYSRSRDVLGTADAPVQTIDNLGEFLAGLRRHARIVLATNAPAAGIERVLNAWGVRDRFDDVRVSVGKPAGLTPIIEQALESGPVLAIGDIVEYDLAPAIALGADTALVGATAATSPASVTMRGATLTDLRPDIEAWAATAESRTPAP
ncbi:MAG TPA: HAD family hydrolase [Candidatus Agrococcus pullicola]|uniref:HAD family hydrolase n=1 Tax=Candidatus Agrococcus pullicola TaxID=2838429 RepID=A0A9D2CA85_9MICO|nr:HAD family hydrolase [Candidatus Agrococcus pullicola]